MDKKIILSFLCLWAYGASFGQSGGANSLISVLDAGISAGYPGIIVGYKSPDSNAQIMAKGYSNLEQQIEMSQQERFHLASVTKLYTAIATLQLVDLEKLSLDDTVDALLNDPVIDSIPNTNKIKVRHLLDHSSGIYSFNNDMAYLETLLGTKVDQDIRWTPQDLLLLAKASRVQPLGEPGEGHFYSDANYVLLGLIIEEISGLRFRQYIDRHILQPLDLKNTGFYGDDTNAQELSVKPTVEGYLQRSEALDNFIELAPAFSEVQEGLVNTSTAGERIDASAGMVGTIEDLLTLGEALYFGHLLSEKSLNFLLSIGDGIEQQPLDTKRQGIVSVRHKPYGVLFSSLGDGGGGMNTMLAYHPKTKTIVAAFTNVFGNFNEHDYFINQVTPALLELED